MKIIQFHFILLCSILFFNLPTLRAQQFTKVDAVQHFQKNLQKLGLEQSDLNEIEVTNNYFNQRTGLTHIYLRQQYQGVAIKDGLASVSIKPNGEIFSFTNKFVPKLLDKIEGNAPSLTKKQAIEAAASQLNLTITESIKQVDEENKKPNQVMFSHAGISRRNIPVRALYETTPQGTLRLVWETEIYELANNDWWLMRIDATTGKEISRENIILHCAFGGPEIDHSNHDHYHATVPAADPLLVLAPKVNTQQAEAVTKVETAENSSMTLTGNYNHFPLPLESPIHFEAMNPNSPSDGRQNLSINEIVDLRASPFGWHDTDGDASTAEFTWTQGNNTLAFWDPDNTLVNAGVPNIMPTPFTTVGDLNIGNVPDGGESLDFNITNNIDNVNFNAFVPDAVTNLFVWNNIIHDVSYLYGFDEASGNFQTNNHGNGGLGNDHVLAGAQAMGFVNNASFGTPVDGMSPTMSMYLWDSDLPNRTVDGDFDSGVIGHEYGHGISTRMVGGPDVRCLGGTEQGGEGWSDFVALLTTLTDINQNGVYEEDVVGEGIRGIGNYVTNDPFDAGGIRPTAYTTNMNLNSFTYGDVPDLTAPHGVGYGWCTIMWDLTWALINKYGFEPDIYNKDSDAGNIRAMATVIEGFRHTACNPTFIDMREGLFDAYEALFPEDFVEDELLMWEVFARRGLGFSAEAEGNEAFDLPTFASFKNVNLIEQGKGGQLLYTITVQNNFTSPLTNVQITDDLDNRLIFVSSADGATESNGTVTFPGFSIPVGQSISKTFVAQIDPSTEHTELLASNDVEAGETFGTFLTVGAWTLATDQVHSGTTAYFHPDVEVLSAGDLVYNVTLPANTSAMSFWQRLDTEGAFDGGVFEISTDNGISYTDLGDRMIKNKYNSIISSDFSGVPLTVLDGRRAFSGQAPYFQTIVDLSGYSDAVSFRWRFASDAAEGGVGWWIDDIEFLNLKNIKNETCVTTAQFPEEDCSDVGTLGTIIRDNGFLPIELVGLSASPQGSNIRLDWTTSSETNHDGFEVLRRAENETAFTAIGFVKGQGTTSKSTDYQYLDENVKANIRYFYQLKLRDDNGKEDLSNIVTAIIQAEDTAVQVFPNPASDQVVLSMTGASLGELIEVAVLDVTGQLIRRFQLDSNDKNYFSLDFSDLPEQLYLIRVTSGHFVDTKQVLIQR